MKSTLTNVKNDLLDLKVYENVETIQYKIFLYMILM